jgi:hypothetical protein
MSYLVVRLVMNLLITQHLLNEFPDVFSEKPDLLSIKEHSIDIMEISGFVPRTMREYKIPEALKKEADEQLQEMLPLRII